MALDMDTLGYFLYMEEQERQNIDRYNEEDTDQEQEDKEGLYNG